MGWSGVSWAVLGCNAPDDRAGAGGAGRISLPPAAAAPAVIRPLAVADGVNTAPDTGASPIAGASVDARVLVITATGNNAAFNAIENTLEYLGTPFDVLNASTGPALTADALGSGAHGKYNAVFLDVGDLSAARFTDAEWAALTTYEVEFGVRRVSLYTSPNASYGLADDDVGVDPDDGADLGDLHRGRRGALRRGRTAPTPSSSIRAMPTRPSATDSATTPLLVDASGNVYAATRSYPDGREALALTFGQASSYVSYLELAYGLVSWATRGLFVGERHVYAVPQIDDLFLSSAIYTGGVYRITDADLQAFADWQSATRAKPLTAGFRAAWAANGAGSSSRPGDPLTAKAVALGAGIRLDQPQLGSSGARRRSATPQCRHRVHPERSVPARARASCPTRRINAVTPNVSGLGSADAMRAIHDVGIQQIVSDTSVTGENNPSPNAGIWNALEPSVLEIPRKATDLYFNVSQPSEWIPEYEALARCRRARLSDPGDDPERRRSSGYMLNGSNDPWMFHQANARDYDGAGHSLLSDLLDATFAKYAAVMTFPVVSPTMDDLATRVRNRMALDASGVVATVASGSLTRHGGPRCHGPGHGPLHPGRGELRRTDHLVPHARRRAVGDLPARRLLGRGGKRWHDRQRRRHGRRRPRRLRRRWTEPRRCRWRRGRIAARRPGHRWRFEPRRRRGPAIARRLRLLARRDAISVSARGRSASSPARSPQVVGVPAGACADSSGCARGNRLATAPAPNGSDRTADIAASRGTRPARFMLADPGRGRRAGSGS